MSFYLDHEKLEVYRFAIQFVVLADEIAENLPRGRAYLVDQLRRAGSSIPLNLKNAVAYEKSPQSFDPQGRNTE